MNSAAQPSDERGLVLRWAGGKRHAVGLVNQIAVLNSAGGTFVDPFLGGGSLTLGTPLERKIASDSNAELVNFMLQSKFAPNALINRLAAMRDDSETFYKVRADRPEDPIDAAARFLYLNRTGYMGLYRTNARGQYNVPYGGGGRLNQASLAFQLPALSRRLENTELACQDFRATATRAAKGDMLVLDPPYGHSGDAPFRRYGGVVFSETDHDDLVSVAERAASKGVVVLATLPYDPRILSRYREWCVLATRSLGAAKISEVILSPANLRSPKSSASPGWSVTGGVGPAKTFPNGFWAKLNLD